ncbi:hypothetical protein EW026_g6354 [Hermanssonia centrifuga]|uniref:Carbonic anhydrase n=1 Tax=Hermanssonia centrifuga TaxID=98765 RepID=A0A4S4KB99_9APHY|nr:hypothetical protein EW026_g6354 [Hermanssonia centrifuga]
MTSQVHLDDDNILSVLTYAVIHLGVEHVVVVGHTNCGGVAACLAGASQPSSPPSSSLERWLNPLTNIARSLKSPSSHELVEASVRQQVQNVLESDVIKMAWSADPAERGQAKLLGVHGWVYEIESGHVKDLGVSAYGR